MSGRATGDDSGLIDLDSIMKGAAPAPTASTPTAAAPASSPAPRPRADDSLAAAAVTTDRPPPSLASVPTVASPPSVPPRSSTPPIEGVAPTMKPIGVAPIERSSTRGRSTARTVAIIAAGLALVAGTVGVARMRASHSPAALASPPPDPAREKNNAPTSQPAPQAAVPASPGESTDPSTPVGALGQPSPGAAASARARSASAAPARAAAEAPAGNAELHTTDLPTAPAGGSLDLGGAMKSAVNATDDVAGATGDPSGGSKARTVRPSPGAVLGALNAVLPAARACLSPDEAMRSGTVVFASSGAVSRVDLAGNKGSDGCIRDAISRARIEPFADDSFTTRITIRP